MCFVPLSSPAPDRHALSARGGRLSDPDLQRSGPFTEAGRPPPVLLLQRQPGPVAGLEQLPRAPAPHGVEGRLRILLVRRKDHGSQSRSEPEGPDTGVPVCNVSLETQPPGGQVQKGERLALICMVARGTGDITFLWYKGALGLNLETKTQRSLAAKFEIPAVRDSDTDKYYCAADNGYGPSLSELVSVTVRIPVSRPVLTIRGPGAPAEVGDVVELRCEAQRGSPPILYRFYHKNVTLGRSSAHAGGGASFNLSLTAEHSGNYSCEADNGLGARRSKAVPLNVTVPTEDRKELLASGILEGMLGVLGPVILALFCCGLRKRLGRRPSGNPRGSPPSPVPPASSYVNSPAPLQGQSVYENANVVRGDEVYSLVYHTQQERPPAVPPPRTRIEDQVSQNPHRTFPPAHLSSADGSSNFKTYGHLAKPKCLQGLSLPLSPHTVG
ncbi:Fc receptor-like protein 1 isoform X1 [Lynx rufus]|uniref:Fc receptor-like protein 1 isoform X1 n=1 Tax=Lynx rufus TaxID=61384 RepID=UPI001F1230C3|nr:Fc receptor-like protein 1 isoform X1 [Lynx rufus]XP_046948622.1 Fc receptor-like protein 1 isoform X1 [Lynx rufus]